jgi:hypothetical protein
MVVVVVVLLLLLRDGCVARWRRGRDSQSVRCARRLVVMWLRRMCVEREEED